MVKIKRIRRPYVVHVVLVVVGVLAVATAAHAARHYAGVSFFPPEPRTLVPASAAAYALLSGDGSGATADQRALDGLAATTRIRRGTLTEGAALLASLGDHVGIVRWSGTRSGAGPAMALITQLKISDVVALTGDAAVRRRVQVLRQGVSWRVAYVHDGVKVYRFSIGSAGVAYGCLVAGDGVFASDPATTNRIIEANGGA